MKPVRSVVLIVCLLLAMATACSRNEREGFPKFSGAVSYTLEDGEEYHAANPATFEIPPLERRMRLAPGEIVKLMFRISDGRKSLVERMWVVVEGRTANGYTGRLDNDPTSTDKIRAGMKVDFESRHVINILIRDAHPEPKKANEAPEPTRGAVTSPDTGTAPNPTRGSPLAWGALL
jgi:hypothetical protein